MDGAPNCYDCKHRRDVPGDAHSQCAHPSIVSPSMIGDAIRRLNVTGDIHGIRHGWFFWPFNFDPVWLKTCDGFEPRKQAL